MKDFMKLDQQKILKVLSQGLGEAHTARVEGVLRGGRLYKGYFYAMCGLTPRRFKLERKQV